ncbi:9112_t:CDS:2 [Racocetra persica]|uniref:9112_t:CDS:1 n=1 Tax=Racocetra persica TaxID=160502 RepID=A0ACA9N1H8_9GLOM|nr:9112_t:CDS:2 [Racocetra persica]
MLQRQLTTSTNMRLKMLSSIQIANEIISCWVAVMKASCLSFSFTFTNQTYIELDEALKIEHILLLKKHQDKETSIKKQNSSTFATEKKAALIHRRVEFYKQISYILLNDNGTFNKYINLHSGDIVQIQEETSLSYATLKGIFTHKYNDGLVYSFIWVNWLWECSILDPILQYSVYEKQTAENAK